MSRKDYLALAAVIANELQDIRETKTTSSTHPCKFTLLMVAYAMCEVFAQDNPNFDEDRFMGACGFNYLPPPHEMSLAARWAV